MDNCTLDCIEVLGNYTQEGMCDFVQEYCVQDTIQIVQGYYCLINSSFMILTILSVISSSFRSLCCLWSIIL